MNKLNFFSKNELSKIELRQISGGEEKVTGLDTSACEETCNSSNETTDCIMHGDWVSTC